MLGVVLLWAALPTHSATWADPAKTLRVVFEIDVTGRPAGAIPPLRATLARLSLDRKHDLPDVLR